jgi:translation initiation factor IF-3
MRYFTNYQIRATDVICIDHQEKNIGSIPIRDAIALAQANGMDLVMVSPARNGNPPICKILDFGKFKYEQDKKDKVLKKKQREHAVKIKEIKFRPNTGDNDLMIKAKQMQEFLDEGNRIKVTIVFRGRELSHKEIGFDTLRKFGSMLNDSAFDADPVMSGKMLTVTLIRKSQES